MKLIIKLKKTKKGDTFTFRSPVVLEVDKVIDNTIEFVVKELKRIK